MESDWGCWGSGIACMQYVLDKGQEQDWFADERIRWAMVFLVLGFAAFLLREFLHKQALVNVRALSDRNLAIGCALIFLLGAALYSLTTILPVFYQTLMGYDATHAGLAVSPRGLGSVVAAVAVGALSTKIDPRKMVALGFAILAGSTLWLGALTLQISPTTLFWPITIGGLGISMVFCAAVQRCAGHD